MNSKLLYLLLLLPIIFSCEEEKLDSSKEIDSVIQSKLEFSFEGNYVGTFERGEQVAQVHFYFDDGVFKGGSEKDFPLLCPGLGSYSVSNEEITFFPDCGFIATLDHSLMIDGAWQISNQNAEITLTNDIGDIYRLTKVLK